ncbi:hypothetical protein H0H93_008314 [Arthromyces matolae]|nr:hypothetical protein H0H93_008314 [Arthromyces matolae]
MRTYGPYHALAPAIHSITRATHRPSPRSSLSARLSSTLTVPSDTHIPSELSPSAYLRQRKFNDLKYSLLQDASPSRVWAHYSDLLNVMGFEKLPLQVHQHVLRRCTPSSAELRVTTPKRLVAGNRSEVPHIHEGRFQTIIRNMRGCDEGGPTLDDYHFILEQFAATGHHVGALHVYRDLIHVGLEPKSKTFGLCLQAIAHRMVLPVRNSRKEAMAHETRRMMLDIVREMRKRHIPFTSVNLDLTIRILKETLDMPTFEELMKWGYGIDLSNPDHPPLESMDGQNIKSDLGLDTSSTGFPAPQPFSTAALNTTIDILGRIGNVSKLVQAFEVLTQPLPPSAYTYSSFDDDDDFGAGRSSQTQVPPWTPPHAVPNTTSYIMMIRHICWLGHPTLARHYAREAIFLDYQKDRRTKKKISKKQEVTAPAVAVNRGTLLPILGLANRDKHLSLARWLTRKFPGILKRKRENLEYYTRYRIKFHRIVAHQQRLAEQKARTEERRAGIKARRERRALRVEKRRARKERLREAWRAQKAMEEVKEASAGDVSTVETNVIDTSEGKTPPEIPTASSARSHTLIDQTSTSDDVSPSPVNTPSTDTTTDESARTSSVAEEPIPLLERSHRNKPKEVGLFDLDLEAPPPPPSKAKARLLDIDLHLRVLERDIAELEELWERTDMVLGRTIQRKKEYLGRRVWAGKDIYLAAENRRLRVSREHWAKNVGFKPTPTRTLPPKRNTTIPTSSPASRRSSSPTFFESNRVEKSEAPLRVLEHLNDSDSDKSNLQ